MKIGIIVVICAALLLILLYIFQRVKAPAVNAATRLPSPAIQEILELTRLVGNPLDQMTPEYVLKIRAQREADATKDPGVHPLAIETQNLTAHGRDRDIPLRLYRPAQAVGPLPLVIYIHGGGWALGSLKTYDQIAGGLAEKSGAIVIAISYRLAPENPFPAGLRDTEDAFDWILNNAEKLGGDRQRVALAGDSAGGNLAIVNAFRAGEKGFKLSSLNLFYPAVDLSNLETPSFQTFETGYLLTKKSIVDFRSFYVPDPKDWTDPRVSPLLAADKELALLPPVSLVIAGCDPLRDQELLFAERLRRLEVKITVEDYSSMVHGFLGFFNAKRTARAAAEVQPILEAAATKIRERFL